VKTKVTAIEGVFRWFHSFDIHAHAFEEVGFVFLHIGLVLLISLGFLLAMCDSSGIQLMMCLSHINYAIL